MATKAASSVATLKSIVAATSALIVQLLATTKVASAKSTGEHPSKLNVLDLVHDAASLVKAHSTKLSLLIINEPFTPTAISTVLREVSSTALPVLASAIELCDNESYPKVIQGELRWRIQNIYTEFAVLLNSIPLDGKVLSKNERDGTGAMNRKGSLANTGVVWKACDDVMELKKLGIPGILIQKLEQYRATLQDALEELKEWSEEESDDEDSGIGSDEEEDTSQAAIDSLFNGQKHIPKDDTNKVRDRLDLALQRLKLITLLYQAVVKRRIKTLPPLTHDVVRSTKEPSETVRRKVDEVMETLRKVPDIFDEMASAFYELNTQDIDIRMDECCSAACAVAMLLKKNWEGNEDEFTTWAEKFEAALVKGKGASVQKPLSK